MASKVVNLRISDELMARIDKACKKTGEDRSTWMRNALLTQLGDAKALSISARLDRLEKEVFTA